MTTETERCQYLFANLLRHSQHGAVNKEHCIAAAEAGAWCLAEIDRLNKWADGFSDAQLKERRLCEERIQEVQRENERLRAQLTEVRNASVMPLPDIGAHSGRSFCDAATSRLDRCYRAAIIGLAPAVKRPAP